MLFPYKWASDWYILGDKTQYQNDGVQHNGRRRKQIFEGHKCEEGDLRFVNPAKPKAITRRRDGET